MTKSGIYKILNLVDGKFYIGSANNIARRFIEHRKLLRHNKHPNSYFQNAWNKHWEHNFKFLIIELVEYKENLLAREQFWIDLTECYKRDIGYNLNPTAGSNLGYKFSDDFREKRVKIQTGKKPSQETKDKMSQSHKDRKRADNIGALISAGKKGKGVGRKLPKATIEKMKASQKLRRDQEFFNNITSVIELKE